MQPSMQQRGRGSSTRARQSQMSLDAMIAARTVSTFQYHLPRGGCPSPFLAVKPRSLILHPEGCQPWNQRCTCPENTLCQRRVILPDFLGALPVSLRGCKKATGGIRSFSTKAYDHGFVSHRAGSRPTAQKKSESQCSLVPRCSPGKYSAKPTRALDFVEKKNDHETTSQPLLNTVTAHGDPTHVNPQADPSKPIKGLESKATRDTNEIKRLENNAKHLSHLPKKRKRLQQSKNPKPKTSTDQLKSGASLSTLPIQPGR